MAEGQARWVKGPRRRRRRCPFCGTLYYPHPRQGERQRCCGAAECQRQRHRQADRAWHARHPEYDCARRLAELTRRLEPPETRGDVVRREPEPGRRLPVDEAQDAFGVQGVGIILIIARLLRQYSQDTIRAQLSDITGKFPQLLAPDLQDAMGQAALREHDRHDDERERWPTPSR